MLYLHRHWVTLFLHKCFVLAQEVEKKRQYVLAGVAHHPVVKAVVIQIEVGTSSQHMACVESSVRGAAGPAEARLLPQPGAGARDCSGVCQRLQSESLWA